MKCQPITIHLFMLPTILNRGAQGAVSVAMDCEGCNYSFLKLVKKFLEEEELTLEYLKSHGVLPKNVGCPTCHSNCKFKPFVWVFYCSKTHTDNRSRRIIVNLQ